MVSEVVSIQVHTPQLHFQQACSELLARLLYNRRMQGLTFPLSFGYPRDQ